MGERAERGVGAVFEPGGHPGSSSKLRRAPATTQALPAWNQRLVPAGFSAAELAAAIFLDFCWVGRRFLLPRVLVLRTGE